jgi:hypothetical protein
MTATGLFLMGSLEQFSLLEVPGPPDMGVFPSTTTKIMKESCAGYASVYTRVREKANILFAGM